MNGSRKQGFTLIELLVVIAIIAILAAILFPVFTTAREKARQTSCLSNEKQIGIAMMQYVQDNDEEYPEGASISVYNTGGVATYPGMGWASQIYPYLKSKGVFYCPSDQSYPTVTWAVPDGYGPISYSFNANLAGLSLSRFNSVSSTVASYEVTGAMSCVTAAICNGGFADFSPSGNFSTYQTVGTADSNGSVQYIPAPVGAVGGLCIRTTVQARHSTGANWLMADGHAKFLNGPQVSAGADATSQSADTTFSYTGAFTFGSCPSVLPPPGGGSSQVWGPTDYGTGAAAGTGFGGVSAKTGGTFAVTFSYT